MPDFIPRLPFFPGYIPGEGRPSLRDFRREQRERAAAREEFNQTAAAVAASTGRTLTELLREPVTTIRGSTTFEELLRGSRFNEANEWHAFTREMRQLEERLLGERRVTPPVTVRPPLQPARTTPVIDTSVIGERFVLPEEPARPPPPPPPGDPPVRPPPPPPPAIPTEDLPTSPAGGGGGRPPTLSGELFKVVKGAGKALGRASLRGLNVLGPFVEQLGYWDEYLNAGEKISAKRRAQRGTGPRARGGKRTALPVAATIPSAAVPKRVKTPVKTPTRAPAPSDFRSVFGDPYSAPYDPTLTTPGRDVSRRVATPVPTRVPLAEPLLRLQPTLRPRSQPRPRPQPVVRPRGRAQPQPRAGAVPELIEVLFPGPLGDLVRSLPEDLLTATPGITALTENPPRASPQSGRSTEPSSSTSPSTARCPSSDPCMRRAADKRREQRRKKKACTQLVKKEISVCQQSKSNGA